jgi:hypothetical protein
VRRIKVAELAARDLDQIGWKAFRTLAMKDGFGGSILEASTMVKTSVS